MIEKGLLYIYTAGDTPRFVGCGVLVEGPYIATCRHVWRMATHAEGAASDAVEVIFPHVWQHGAREQRRATIADHCDPTDGPPADLVLLALEDIPSGVTALQLAYAERYETGMAVAVAGLVGRGTAGAIDDVSIRGCLADEIRSDGRRQFTGSNPAGFWLERGSSGSPVFLANAQQLAGILSLSELGANDGKSHLHEACVVRGQTIREHVGRAIAARAAHDQRIPVEDLREVIDAIGAADVPLAEIPARIRRFVDDSLTLGAERAPVSNLGGDIDASVTAARELVGAFKPEEALSLLRAKIAEENAERARRLGPLLREQARIQRIAFDNDAARATLAEITRVDPMDVWSWFELGDLWMIAGDLSEAAAAFRNGQTAAEATGDERDLSVSHDRIGDVLVAQGEGPAALDAYRHSLDIRETLARRDPANTGWQRDLSVSHDRIGDVLVAQGEGPAALDAYRRSLDIRETLAGRDPANTGWQRDLSVSHNKVGDVLVAQGEGPAALDAYRRSLDIAEALARRDPANTGWQRDLSVSHNNVGDVLVAQGEGPAALDAYRRSLDIAEALAGRDPANTEWQRDLSVSHNKVGDVLVAQGEGPAALDAYRRSLDIAEALARRDPANTGWQRDLSVSHNKVGDVLVAQGEGPAALDAYRHSLDIRETLAGRDPANTGWQRDLSVSHNKVGDVLVAQGEGPAALDAYRRSLDIRETLARRDPANTGWQRDLSVSHDRIGDVLVAQGEGPAALDAYRRSLDIAETLARRDPANTGWQRDLSVSHNKVGDVLVAQGEGPAALDAYRRSLDIRETLARRDPANTEWQRDLSVSHNKVGDVLVAQGEGPAALDAYRRSLDIRETLARRDPANTEWQRDLIVSYVKFSEVVPGSTKDYLERALAIVRSLHETGRLAPVDHWMIADLERRLSEL